MTRIIAVVNMKGGVGKTSTVISLADAIGATSRSSVLVIDVDTQANASFCLLGEDLRATISSGKTVDTFLRRVFSEKSAPSISEYIRRNVSNTLARGKQANISLLASSTDLRVSEREVIRELSRSGETLDGVEVKLLNALRHHIATLGNEFDYIIVDCAPGISPFTSAAIGMADLVVLPTIPDFLSDLGLHSFVANFGPNLPFAVAKKKPRVLFTRSQARGKKSRLWNPARGKNEMINTHKKYEDEIRKRSTAKDAGFMVFKQAIDESPAMPAAMAMGGVAGKTVTFQQKYPGSLGEAVVAVKDEILEVLK